MMDVLLKVIDEFKAVYLDDLVVFSSNWEEHLVYLRVVVQRLRGAWLMAKTAMCQIGMQECIHLGHVVGDGQVKPDTGKLDAVSAKKEVRPFQGLMRYYKKVIPNYSTIAQHYTISV